MGFEEMFEKMKNDISVGERNFNVTINSLDEGMQTEVIMGASKHRFVVDSPEPMGGTDAGPSPLLYLLGSLGACLMSLIRFWARIMNVQIDSIRINSRGHINLASIFGLAEDLLPGFDKIEPVITIKSPESQEKIDELMDKVYAHTPGIIAFCQENPVNCKVRLRK
ncbi:MAG: OsmC family protein [Promethearchaeota archaeon]